MRSLVDGPGPREDSPQVSSLRHSVPDRYIRHTDYVLRIDPLAGDSPAQDREDATFQIGY